MGHHSDESFDDDDPKRAEILRKMKAELLDTSTFRGALGDHPQGQLTKNDQGAIQFAVGVYEGKVVLDFGTPVHWIGMSAQHAANLASLLLNRARELARKTGETVTMEIPTKR